MKLKSLQYINKMPRLSKNQKIRQNTQKLLNDLKPKLNPRTFKSFTDEITNKRIDVVKRLADNLKTLMSSSETNVTKKTFTFAVQEVKSKFANVIKTKLQKQMNRRMIRRICKIGTATRRC